MLIYVKSQYADAFFAITRWRLLQGCLAVFRPASAIDISCLSVTVGFGNSKYIYICYLPVECIMSPYLFKIDVVYEIQSKQIIKGRQQKIYSKITHRKRESTL